MFLQRKVFFLAFLYLLGMNFFYCPLGHADVDTKKLIAGYGSSDPALNALTAPPADPVLIPQGNAQALYIRTPSNPLGTSKTEQSLAGFFALNPNSNAADDIIANIVNSTLTFGDPGASPPSATGLYASCSKELIQAGSSGLSECLLQKQAPPFANVDLNTLVGPLVYERGQEKIANNFISSLAGLSAPFIPADLRKLADKQNVPIKTLIATNPDVANYIALVRSYATLQGIALSNLYQLYAERMPTKVDPANNRELATALAGINMPNASQLQVENYMATRRITDPQWVTGLIKDNPSALLRQIVILLAENLAESYNNRLASERIIATLSALDLQQTAMLRSMVLDKATADLNKPGPGK